MFLSKYHLKNIQSDKVQLPDEAMFHLPERVLQFGTGALLRGLPDYFIDKANRQGIFWKPVAASGRFQGIIGHDVEGQMESLIQFILPLLR